VFHLRDDVKKEVWMTMVGANSAQEVVFRESTATKQMGQIVG
jgi:hypothetical protein